LPRRCRLKKRPEWSEISDLVGTVAVVLSLVYVGLQVRQNTAAIHTTTSQGVYELNQAQSLLVMESAELAEILHQAEVGDELSPADSIRYNNYLNGKVNLFEAVYTHALQGTMELEMAAGWLAGMGSLRCVGGMDAYWARKRTEYHGTFRTALDSAFSETQCPN
jgi:hypothetical protein